MIYPPIRKKTVAHRKAVGGSAAVALAAGALGAAELAQAAPTQAPSARQSLLRPESYRIMEDGSLVFALENGEQLSLREEQYLVLEDGLVLVVDELAQAAMATLPVIGSLPSPLSSEIEPVRSPDGSVVEVISGEPLWEGEGAMPRLFDAVALQRYELAQDLDQSDPEATMALSLAGTPGLMVLLGMLMTSEQPATEGSDEPAAEATKESYIRPLFSREIDFSGHVFGYVEVRGDVYFEAYSGSDYAWKYSGSGEPQIVTSGSTNLRMDFVSPQSVQVPVVDFQGSIYFSEDNIWEYDGETATQKTSIGDGKTSDFYALTVFNDNLYFRADDGTNGLELWKFDGVDASMVNGASGINSSGDSQPDVTSGGYGEGLTIFDGKLYFPADDGTNGFELWEYDGTTASMLGGATGINASGGSSPADLTVYNNNLYFSADDGVMGTELWKYDGTDVTRITDLNPAANSSNVDELIVFDGKLFFSAGSDADGIELWAYNGTDTRMTDILPGTESSEVRDLSVANGKLYFRALVPDKDSDGSSDETVLSYDSTNGLVDLLPAGTTPSTLGKGNTWAAVALEDNVYFEASNDTYGSELWVTDGTLEGTEVIDTVPGADGLYPAYLTSTSFGIFFTSKDPSEGDSPWMIELI